MIAAADRTVAGETDSYRRSALAGKYALVTGGTTGIGRATALLLASCGAQVLIFGRHEKELSDAVTAIQETGGNVSGLTADVSTDAGVRKVFEYVDSELVRLDFLINNAAIGGDDMMKTSYGDWKYVIDTNLLGYIACAKAAAERMEKNSDGHIVNIGSISAEKRGSGSEIYTATKSAVRGWSVALGKTLKKKGIRVTLIEPGLVGSDMVDFSVKEQRQKIQAEEMLTAEDIAECVLYCLLQPKRCAVGFIQIGPLQAEE